ncbi:MAG: SDR family NAD(P)-dependent oxidoreductase [Methanobacteriota archaeon]|nr:MAG: SDR family NAD(P)-dependent oxidoreductase [Euryarchaeota archaeon]
MRIAERVNATPLHPSHPIHPHTQHGREAGCCFRREPGVRNEARRRDAVPPAPFCSARICCSPCLLCCPAFALPPPCSIGLEICRLLGKSMHVIMGCRDLEKGEAAARALVTEGSNVTAHALDITSDASVAALAHTIADKHGAKLDVLINNAGFAYKGDAFGAEEARTTIGVNVYGTMRLTDALLPFIKYVARAHAPPTHALSHTAMPGFDVHPPHARPRVCVCRCRLSTHGGRVVNVCSQAGRLSQVSPALQARFQDPEATPESVTKLMEEFIAAVADGSYEAKGWPRSMYGVSKVRAIPTLARSAGETCDKRPA